MNERGRARAIACLYAHEHVGDGRLQPDELDALAAEAARHGDDSPFDNRVGEFAQPGLDDGAHPVGELENHRQALAGGDRRAPHDVVTIGQCLGQLEVRRARFVRHRARMMSNDRDTCDREEPRDASKESARDTHGVDFARGRPRSGRNTRRFGETNLVMRLHRLERALPRSGTLLIEPCRLDLRLDFVVRGNAPGSD